MYFEKRRRQWFALHDIPADVRVALGKNKFFQSLKTDSLSTAKLRAAALGLEFKWRRAIEEARRPGSDPMERNAAFWRDALKTAPNEEDRELVLMGIEIEADKIADGVKNGRVPDRDELDPEADARAGRFYKLATGALVRMDEHLEEYLATLRNEAKSVDMKRTTIKRFSESFAYIADVHRKEVQQWVNKLAQDGKAVATIRRALSELRGYWSYLVSIDAASVDNLPFEKLSVPKPPKGSNGDQRRPFAPGEVVKLLQAAHKKGDRQLADLICLAMWTGARIEELCALKTDNVKKGCFSVEDAKTPAGWREVPIHAKLRPTMDRLVKDSTDGYVLSGLTFNKYEDRSNAIGKRFGKLKKAEGFGPRHVFHSIRKTVATLFENAGIPEGVAADIIGHDKPTMTYGVYSGGSSLQTKRAALAKLRYPGFDKVPVFGQPTEK